MKLWTLYTHAGYYGITAQECQARGCCWAPTTARSSHAASARKLHAASGPAAGKQGAGFAGLHGQRGVGDVPWCFHPNAHSQDHYIVQSLQETGVRCGWEAVTRSKQACHAFGSLRTRALHAHIQAVGGLLVPYVDMYMMNSVRHALAPEPPHLLLMQVHTSHLQTCAAGSRI